MDALDGYTTNGDEQQREIKKVQRRLSKLNKFGEPYIDLEN